MKELINITQKLKSPKNNTNDFGHFQYRSLSDILDNIKPLLNEYQCTLTFNDRLVDISGRIFIESTAYFKNSNGEIEQATAYAEIDDNNSMSKEQHTGSSSSYARKYAAESLFCISSSVDIDSLDNNNKGNSVKTTVVTKSNADILKDFCSSKKKEEGIDKNQLLKFFNYWNGRLGTWKGTIDPEKLWQKELARTTK